MPRVLPSLPWLLAGVVLLALTVLAALGPNFADVHRGSVPLPDASGSSVEYATDRNASMDFAAMRALPEQAWQRWDGDGYVHCPRDEAVWVRITLKNSSPLALRGILAEAEVHTDRLDFWTQDPDAPGGWRHARSGEWATPAERSLRGPASAFFIRVPAQGEQVAYLRVQDHFGVWFRPVWWPDERAFLSAQLNGAIAEALYFGVLLALFVYNGVLWLRLRYPDLGHYLGYVACFGVFMFFSRSLAPLLGRALGSPIMEILVTVSLAGSGVFQIRFARTFLNLAGVAPRLDRLMRLLGWIAGGLALGGLAFPWFQSTAWLHVTVGGMATIHGFLILGGILAWRAGALHARYFVLSFGLLLLGILPMVLRWLLAIPVGLSPLAVLLGSALEMLLLSLALADRFTRLQRERHAAQLAAESARLEMLRYQLNPHFLFNALNSLYGLVYPQSRSAGDLVRRLADFCRGIYARDLREFRPLHDELTMLRTYLDIEQARWRERLVVTCDFDPAADDFAVPPYLLLPLVDNAIKHGGHTSAGVLTVRLATQRDGDGSLIFTLMNTGTWSDPGAPRRAASTGVGLANLRERLRRVFGPAHEIHTVAADGWVTVTLRLPRIATQQLANRNA